MYCLLLPTFTSTLTCYHQKTYTTPSTDAELKVTSKRLKCLNTRVAAGCMRLDGYTSDWLKQEISFPINSEGVSPRFKHFNAPTDHFPKSEIFQRLVKKLPITRLVLA